MWYHLECKKPTARKWVWQCASGDRAHLEALAVEYAASTGLLYRVRPQED
jgi:hypothetical protein